MYIASYMYICTYIYTLLANSFPYSCRANDVRTSVAPELCHDYYTFGGSSNNAIYDGDLLPGIPQALNVTLMNISSSTPDHLNHCVELLERYLCHYYFPMCRVNRNEIEPVCSSSCNLLLNDDDCSDLLVTALHIIADHNITLSPDDDMCVMTYRPFNGSGKPSISSDCRSLEG